MLEARAHGYMCCLASISEFQHFKTTWSNGRKVCFGFGCWKGSTYIMTCNQFHNWSGVVELLVLPQTKSTTGFERWFALFKGVNFHFPRELCTCNLSGPGWVSLCQEDKTRALVLCRRSDKSCDLAKFVHQRWSKWKIIEVIAQQIFMKETTC